MMALIQRRPIASLLSHSNVPLERLSSRVNLKNDKVRCFEHMTDCTEGIHGRLMLH